MGRGGVTFSEVEQAALHLQSKGRAPTVDGIREYLGTGSRTTLATHLKRWKEAQQDGTGHIPNQLANAVASLWDQLQEQANSRIVAQQEAFSVEIEGARQALSEAREYASRQEMIASETKQQLSAARQEALELRSRLQETTEAREHLALLHEHARSQLDEAKHENQRLHDLSRQIQKNLEHYQAAIQRQKTEDSLRQEKQQNAFRQEISVIGQNLANAEKRLAISEKEAAQHAENAALRQAELTNLREKYDLLLIECREGEKRSLQLSARHDLLFENNQKLMQSLEASDALLQTSKQQQAAFESRAITLESSLARAEDRIASLQHEMLFAIKNKSYKKSKTKEKKQNA